MISAFFKILSVAVLLTGLLAIMVIKNISAEKQKYINELELTLREEQKINELYKIEWDHLVSPMNIKKISEITGWKPQFDIKEGLEKTFKIMKSYYSK